MAQAADRHSLRMWHSSGVESCRSNVCEERRQLGRVLHVPAGCPNQVLSGCCLIMKLLTANLPQFIASHQRDLVPPHFDFEVCLGHAHAMLISGLPFSRSTPDGRSSAYEPRVHSVSLCLTHLQETSPAEESALQGPPLKAAPPPLLNTVHSLLLTARHLHAGRLQLHSPAEPWTQWCRCRLDADPWHPCACPDSCPSVSLLLAGRSEHLQGMV